MDDDPIGDLLFGVVCIIGFIAFALIVLNWNG